MQGERFFEDAPDDDLFELANVKWGGDVPADRVAYFMEDRNKKIRKMFEYLHSPSVRDRKDPPGFECYVNGPDAIKWLKKNRPRLAMAIERKWKGTGPRDWSP